jgi:hypothetical protein
MSYYDRTCTSCGQPATVTGSQPYQGGLTPQPGQPSQPYQGLTGQAGQPYQGGQPYPPSQPPQGGQPYPTGGPYPPPQPYQGAGPYPPYPPYQGAPYQYGANPYQYATYGQLAQETTSPLSKTTCLLLCFYLGTLGVHRFYAGRIGTGILMLLTYGGLGIWLVIDFILICVNQFVDGEGRYVSRPCNLTLVLCLTLLPLFIGVVIVVLIVLGG